MKYPFWEPLNAVYLLFLTLVQVLAMRMQKKNLE